MAYCDVVVGSGLARVCAAVSAAGGLEGKGRVLLASAASYALGACGRNAAPSLCDTDKHRTLWAARSGDDAQAIERDAMKALDRHCVVRRNVAGLEYAARRASCCAMRLRGGSCSAR